jgi:hypothetical protein
VTDHTDRQPRLVLSPDDAAALDWLLEHAWSAEGAPPELLPRIGALLGVLDGLGVGGNSSPARVEAVLALLSRSDAEPMLCEDDQDALDAWVFAGYREERVPAVLRERARSQARVAAMVASPDPAERRTFGLVDATLARIDSAVAAGAAESVPARVRGRLRLTDVASIAAILVISASVLVPFLSASRVNALRSANQANLAVAGLGFGAYSADYAGDLPTIATPADRASWTWWNVGGNPRESNSANLYTLTRLGYTPYQSLASPGNPDAPTHEPAPGAMDWRSPDEVSYSYRLPLPGASAVGPATVVLTDRSPVTTRAYHHQPISLHENSPNNRGLGQHVLRGDGSVVWMTTPYLAGGDHIFLPGPIERAIEAARSGLRVTIQRLGTPEDANDAFVAP